MQYFSMLKNKCICTTAYLQITLSYPRFSFVCSDKPANIKVLPVYSHEHCADRALFESTESIGAFVYLTVSASVSGEVSL